MKVFRFLFKVLLWFIGISVIWVLIYKWVPVPVTPLMAIRTIQQNNKQETIIWKHNWVSIDKISKKY